MNTPSFLASHFRIAGIVSVLAVALFFVTGTHAYAAPASGWIWGGTEDSNSEPNAFDGAGWFSVYAGNPGDTSPDSRYRVDIPYTDGDLSGYAWSEYYGWLSFDTAGCASKGAARRVGNSIVGSAEILASSGTGGFDGCVVFDHGRSNEVTINPATGELSGYAWSSDLGWFNFGPDNGRGGVTIPAVGTPSVNLDDDTCTIPSGGTQCSPALPYTTNGDVVSGEIKNPGGTTVRTIGPNQNSIYTVSPALVGEQSVTYTITGRNAAGTEVNDTGVASSHCTTGETWISGRCQVVVAPGGWIYPRQAPSGVSSQFCDIQTNQSTCTHYLDWEVTNTVTLGKLYNIDSNTLVAQGKPVQGQPGSPKRESVTLDYGDHRYSLCDEVSAPNCNNIGVPVTVRARCADPAASPEPGTGICRVPASAEGDVTASPNPCIIALGSNSCTSNVSWYSVAFSDIPNVYFDEGAGENIFDPGTALNDANTVAYTFTGGPDSVTFTLYEGDNITGTLRDTEIVQATCGSNVWDAGIGKCVDPNALSDAILTCNGGVGPCTCEVFEGSSECIGVQFSTDIEGGYTAAALMRQDTTDELMSNTTGTPDPWLTSPGLPLGTHTYYAAVQGPHPEGGVWPAPGLLSNNVVVTATCESGTAPDTSVPPICVSTANTLDSFNVTDCTIADGASACDATITWETTNVSSVKISSDYSGGTDHVTGGAGDNTSGAPATIAPANGQNSSTYTFTLYEEGSPDVQVGSPTTATVSCANPASTWDGSTCTSASASGNLNVTSSPLNGFSCDAMPIGATECVVDASWTFADTVGQVDFEQPLGTALESNITSGATVPGVANLVPGSDVGVSYEFHLTDDNGSFETDTIDVRCASGNWSASAGQCIGDSYVQIQFEDGSGTMMVPDAGGLPHYQCEIAIGENSCTLDSVGVLTWYVANPHLYISNSSGASLVDDWTASEGGTGGGTVSTGPGLQVPWGDNSYYILADDAGPEIEIDYDSDNSPDGITRINFDVACESGAVWSPVATQCIEDIGPQ